MQVAIGDAAGSPNPPYYSPEMQEYQNANTILRPNLQPTNVQSETLLHFGILAPLSNADRMAGGSP